MNNLAGILSFVTCCIIFTLIIGCSDNTPNTTPKIDESRIDFLGIGDQEIDEDSGEILIADLDDVFSHRENDQLFFEIVSVPDELNMFIDGENMLGINPSQDYNLPYGVEVIIRASDSGQTAIEISFQIMVNYVNDAPVVVHGIEDVVVDEDSGETVIADLDDVFGDVEDAQLVFEFTSAPDELYMSIDDDNQLVLNPSQDYNLPDGVDITVTAFDNEGAEVEEVFHLTVTPVN